MINGNINHFFYFKLIYLIFMITFIVSLVLLFLGYFLYAKFLDKTFKIDVKKETPAYKLRDNVDYIPMSQAKTFFIQLLNIAGLGPIFGAVSGAMFGPVAFLWIVFGSIFGGAVHDYFSGMISLRNNGASLPNIIGKYLGNNMKIVLSILTIIVMILVGTVFMSGPAKLLTGITNNFLTFNQWIGVIFIYYIFAAILPIDKIIGRIYPFFGAALVFMAIGILVSLFINNAPIPEISLKNMHPMGNDFPVFPMMFVSIACGAVSGFHATQSPLMARCLKNEREGRRVFYGAMISEAVIALIWAAAAMSFFGNMENFQEFYLNADSNPAPIITKIATSWLGVVGGILAIIGVIAAPITSGDTAFRSGRLIVADLFNIKQNSIAKRIAVTLPFFIIAFILLQISFDVIWRYFAWVNQLLATITLWAITAYIIQDKGKFIISLIPALFMTCVCSTYIFIAKTDGFGLEHTLAYSIAAVITIAVVLAFYFRVKKNMNNDYKLD